MDWLPNAIRDGIIVILVISGPIVIAAAIIGLIIGVLQAATQVQEQTIGSAVKIIGVFILIIALGLWMYKYLNQYTSRTLSSAFIFVPNQGKKVITPNAFSDMGEGSLRRQQGISKPLLIKPEKLESEIPESIPPSAKDVVGRQRIPKPPSLGEILPPPPKLPSEIPKIKPDFPLSDIQKPIPPPPQNESGANDTDLINIVPENPVKTKKTIQQKLWQKEKVFSYIIEDSKIKSPKNTKKESLSWLNNN